MNEREFRLWTAVMAAMLATRDFEIEGAARKADRAVEVYRERNRAAQAQQYAQPAPFV